MDENIHNSYRQAITSLWSSWAIALGVPTLLCVLGVWVPAPWIPVLCLLCALGLMIKMRINRLSETPHSDVTCYIMSQSMVTSAVIMIVIVFARMHGVIDSFLGETSERSPFIPLLVFAPVILAFSLFAIWRGNEYEYFVERFTWYGTPAEQSYFSHVTYQEDRYQIRFMMRLSLFLTVVGWAYYFIFYINVNINTPDKFVYAWLPLIFYGCSLVYVGTRCFTLWMYYGPDGRDEKIPGQNVTHVRFLIFCQDKIFLTRQDADASATAHAVRLDTPAELSLPIRERLPLYEAEKFFKELSGTSDFDIRFMYVNSVASTGSNVFHYIATMHSPKTIEQSRMKGQWYTLSQLLRLLNNDKLQPLLAAEFHRLYTVTMAWKTYDRRGRRLYKIKNYKPTFRIEDIHNWEVDFNDPQWLFVAHNNEDRLFFRLRRIWAAITRGHHKS